MDDVEKVDNEEENGDNERHRCCKVNPSTRMAEAKSPMGTNADKDNYGENNLWGEDEQNDYELG